MERGTYRNAQYTPSTAADNATATATIAAAPGQAVLAFGLHAQFSAAVAAKKILTLQYTDEAGTSKTLTWELDFALGLGRDVTFPLAIRGKSGEAVVATLAASGAGGTTGTIGIYWSQV